ncbi:hypothetical protein [Streptantibioticus parmotrematis]|nr:hypothetical protein [Streptantibioticus parmotrematis]
MDDVIDAFEMVEGAGRSAVLAQHSVGEAEPDTERASRPTTPKSGSAEPGRWDQAAEISALRNELNRLREILDGGDKPSRSGAPAS